MLSITSISSSFKNMLIKKMTNNVEPLSNCRHKTAFPLVHIAIIKVLFTLYRNIYLMLSSSNTWNAQKLNTKKWSHGKEKLSKEEQTCFKFLVSRKLDSNNIIHQRQDHIITRVNFHFWNHKEKEQAFERDSLINNIRIHFLNH